MQVQMNPAQNNPNFGWLNIKGCKTLSNLSPRIKSVHEIDFIRNLAKECEDIPVEVRITEMAKKPNRLQASIFVTKEMNKSGFIHRTNIKEGFFSSLGSPTKFVRRINDRATKIYHAFLDKKYSVE